MSDEHAPGEGEPDERGPDFRHYAMLRISSAQGLDIEGIGATLGVAPTSVRRRGVRSGPRETRPSAEDVWMYLAPVAEDAELHHHIDALWRVLEPHAAFIGRIKSAAAVVVHLGYLSRMNCAGVSVPHRSLALFRALELDFHLHVTVIADDD